MRIITAIACFGVLLCLLSAFSDAAVPVQAATAAGASASDSDPGLPLLNDIAALNEFRTENGFSNLEPFSLALLREGAGALREGERKKAIALFKDAIEISPDLPEAYVYMARASFSLSPAGLSAAVGYLLDAREALTRNIWWSFRTSGIFLSILYYAFFLSVVICIAVLAATNYRLFRHDVMEDSGKIVLLVPSIILVFPAPVLGLFAFLIPFWAYLRSREKGLVYCMLLGSAAVILSSPYHATLLNSYGNVKLRNIVNVNTGIYTGDRAYVLDTKDDYESRFTHALAQKKKGNFDNAVILYTSLLGKKDDAVIYNNIANCYVGLADYKAAMLFYNKALESAQRASVYYNLSQLSREIFDFRSGDDYYAKAIAINPDEVATYAAMRGQSAGSSVVDEVLGIRDIWLLIFFRPYEAASKGYLGNMYSFLPVWVSVTLMILVVVAAAVFGRRLFSSAYRCEKCGRIFCGECEEKPEEKGICLTCFRSLSQKTLMTPKERMARTIDMYRYRDNRSRIYRVISCILPGSGHIFEGKTFTGYIILFFVFSFAVSMISWSFLAPFDSMTALVSLFQWISGGGLLIMYAFAFITSFRKGGQ